MAHRLGGAVALVTNSHSGMDQAAAEEFAKEGADVVVPYREGQGGAGETWRRVGLCAVVCRLDQREPIEDTARQLDTRRGSVRRPVPSG